MRLRVDTRYLKITDKLTGHAVIQVTPNGENAIIVYGGANEEITKEYVDKVLSDFSRNDLLILQNEIGEVPYIIEKAYRKGMKTVLNPSPFNESIKAIDFDKLSYLILNENEAELRKAIAMNKDKLKKEDLLVIRKCRLDLIKAKNNEEIKKENSL